MALFSHCRNEGYSTSDIISLLAIHLERRSDGTQPIMALATLYPYDSPSGGLGSRLPTASYLHIRLSSLDALLVYKHGQHWQGRGAHRGALLRRRHRFFSLTDQF